MRRYRYRKNCIVNFFDQEKTIRAKIAFKTQELHWLGTHSPVVALLSIHSVFHSGIEGDLKTSAFISTIKNYTKGKATILLADVAHAYALSLKYENGVQRAFKECYKDTEELVKRYQRYFSKCSVAFWHTYICKDRYFAASLRLVKELRDKDSAFQNCLKADAEASYTAQRESEYTNKKAFIEATIEDIVQQCACLLVLSNKGYRFQFYPGKPHKATEYTNQILLPEDKKVHWINVFLSIEKKTIITSVLEREKSFLVTAQNGMA